MRTSIGDVQHRTTKSARTSANVPSSPANLRTDPEIADVVASAKCPSSSSYEPASQPAWDKTRPRQSASAFLAWDSRASAADRTEGASNPATAPSDASPSPSSESALTRLYSANRRASADPADIGE